uniref:Uncharacterized protein n=1 Tax=Arundo donax TaxID=35708 RepID=A0A0A9AE46_ARUDO
MGWNDIQSNEIYSGNFTNVMCSSFPEPLNQATSYNIFRIM